jgi:hypothetical protein
MTKCDDPIECGHEAALGQWEARWEMLKQMLKRAAPVEAWMRVEQELPVGLPVGERYIPRMTGRVTIQLEPERVTRLVEVLTSAGSHPSGLGSYAAAADALAFVEDISNMAEGQGWKR